MQYLTRKECSERITEKVNTELATLETAPDEVIAQRVDKAKDTIKEYLNATKLIGGTITEHVFADLFSADFDTWSQAWNLEEDSLSLIKILTSAKVSQLLEPDDLQRFVDMLYRVSRFASRIKVDYCQAELQLECAEYMGGSNLPRALRVEQAYLHKLKKLTVEV